MNVCVCSHIYTENISFFHGEKKLIVPWILSQTSWKNLFFRIPIKKDSQLYFSLWHFWLVLNRSILVLKIEPFFFIPLEFDVQQRRETFWLMLFWNWWLKFPSKTGNQKCVHWEYRLHSMRLNGEVLQFPFCSLINKKPYYAGRHNIFGQ